jgi:2-phosphoglycerate kinase
MRGRLQHVYWIGGGSGAGKSTIARRVAEEHGLVHYSTDAVMRDHAQRTSPEDSPLLTAFGKMDMDERWVDRDPKTMLDTFHWFAGEGFDLIVEDLLALPPSPAVIVEGFRLLPRLVQPLLATRCHGVWLLPTPEFRRAAFETRSSLWDIPNKTTDPERALQNMLDRDQIFTDRLRQEAEQIGVPTIEVNTAMSADALTDRIATQFGLKQLV